MKQSFNIQGHNRHYFNPEYFKEDLEQFINKLSNEGHSDLTIKSYYDSVAHFSTWLKQKNIVLEKITINTIKDFANHHCKCTPNRRTKKPSRRYINRIQRFLCYLSDQGVILFNTNIAKTPLPYTLVKFKESLQYRGLSSKTIDTYEYSIYKYFRLLNKNPQKYNANNIREAVYETAKANSLCIAKKLTTALKAYLRFLATEEMCRPDLDSAVPTVAQWNLSSLPKYIAPEDLERMIASCDLHTPQGLRDRAIILLLGRLGLRAGDVSNMRVTDILRHCSLDMTSYYAKVDIPRLRKIAQPWPEGATC